MHKGSRAFCLLMALAATGAECASASEPASPAVKAPAVPPGQYRVEAKLVRLSQDEARSAFGSCQSGSLLGYYSQAELSHLIASRDATVISFPQVTASDKLPAVIAMTHPAQLPQVGKREIGVSLKIAPDDKEAALSKFNIAYQNVSIAGFSDAKATTPVFSTQRLSTTVSLDVRPAGEGYWCYALPVKDQSVQIYGADGKKLASIADADERQLLFVKISRG